MFKLKEVVCFFSLNVVQKLVVPFLCFCAVTSASVHLPGKWEGQGLELWQRQRQQPPWLGQAWIRLAYFQRMTSFPLVNYWVLLGHGTCDLHTYWQKGSEILMCFSDHICCYVSSCHNFRTCSCPRLAKTGSFTSNPWFVVCMCFPGHRHVCRSDCYAAQLVCLQPLTFLDNASFSPEIEILKTTSQNSSEAEELFSFHCTFSIVSGLVG